MRTPVIIALDRAISELYKNTERANKVRALVTYKFSRKSMITKPMRVEYVYKHMFVVNGLMQDVVESKTGYSWSNVHRVTLKEVIKELINLYHPFL